MAELTKEGMILANCPRCRARTQFTYKWDSYNGNSYSCVERRDRVDFYWETHKFFKCTGCGLGGVARLKSLSEPYTFPNGGFTLIHFYPDATQGMSLPKDTPKGIREEFREAEACMSHGCYRAASGMFRSVLEKTLRANGYKPGRESLYTMIENAANEKVITQARKRRAHDEIRSLGNDIFHEDWKPVDKESVDITRRYAQRVLEDFYDDRETVKTMLIEVGRMNPDPVK